MLPLAKAGYHVIAPDQRGYGRSGGTDVKFDDDLAPFSTLNRVRDMMALVNALGHRNVALVVGHDFGSPVAGWCALTRPGRLSLGGDDERAVRRRRALPFNTATHRRKPAQPVHGRARASTNELAKLAAAAQALSDLLHDARGEREHVASAAGRAQFPARLLPHEERRLGGRTSRSRWRTTAATEMAKLPRYYVMDLNKGMAESVAGEMPTAAADRELQVAHRRGAARLQRASTGATVSRAACSRIASAACRDCRRSCSCSPAARSMCRRCSCPARATGASISAPAASTAMKRACTKFEGVELLDGAGHWVQQEQAAQVAERLIRFLRAVTTTFPARRQCRDTRSRTSRRAAPAAASSPAR